MKRLCNDMFVFKIGPKLTLNDARKVGLVTVVWARTPPPPPKKKKKNIDQVSELPVVVFVLTRPSRGLESFLASSRHLLFR